jgi:hypothetical protein
MTIGLDWKYQRVNHIWVLNATNIHRIIDSTKFRLQLKKYDLATVDK